ncbi:hypothetical protein ABZP36_021943 [Zizania latifolia]
MSEKDSTDLKSEASEHNAMFSPEAQISCSANALTAMANPFPIPPGLWNPPAQNMGLGETSFSSLLGMLSAGVSPFAATSGFIDSATGFPCYNGGNLGAMINHSFPSIQPLGNFQNGLEPCREIEAMASEGCKNVSLPGEGQQGDAERTHGIVPSAKELSKLECTGGSGHDEWPRPSCSKKRKRSGQDGEVKHVEEGSEQLVTVAAAQKNENGEEGEPKKPAVASGKSSAKQTKDNAGAAKEEYIHVRARRGQATNSHSLAERVRREKISERMKFLQDLVPGCSKVTGKAVMLDEIINYVQSLQRQVEFLSMKLATVNPALDFSVERILSKDIFRSQGITAASAFCFLPDIGHPRLHPPKYTHVGMPSTVNSIDAFGRVPNVPLGTNSAFKEPKHQMPDNFDGEFQDAIKMPFTHNHHESNDKP